MVSLKCPGCASRKVEVFFQVEGMPVHCTVLLRTQHEARQYPRGDIVLGFCHGCGLIYNPSFKPELLNYSPEEDKTAPFGSAGPVSDSFRKAVTCPNQRTYAGVWRHKTDRWNASYVEHRECPDPWICVSLAFLNE